jgi:hypothetical protein
MSEEFYFSPSVDIVSTSELHPLQAEGSMAASFGDFHLSDVYAFDATATFAATAATAAFSRLKHHRFERSEFDARRRRNLESADRHLLLELAVPGQCCSVATERETIMTAATFNWAMYPQSYTESYDQSKNKFNWWSYVFNHDLGLEQIGASSQSPGSPSTGPERAISQDAWWANQTAALAEYLGTDLGSDMGKVGSVHGGGTIWSDTFPNGHFNDGSKDSAGVAMAVYDDGAGTRIFVFRGSYSDGDMNNILNLYADWFLEKFQQRIVDMWTQTGHTVTNEMSERMSEGLIEECLFRQFAPGMGNSVASKIGDWLPVNSTITKADIQHYAYWPIIKQIVRHQLPVDRDRSTEGKIVISGHSQGGFNANMVSMWLEKEDDAIYNSYAFSGTGTQCAARQLSTGSFHTNGYDYLDDVDPYVLHPQLTTFCHPLDGFCNLDYANGRVCSYGDSLFGTNRSGGSDLEAIYANIVGYDGPLMNIDKIHAGPKKWFLESRYWTHSMNFFLVLANEGYKFLDEDGITDGGCYNATIASVDDPDQMCPDGNTSNWKCPFIIFSTAFIVAGAVIACGFAGSAYCYYRRKNRLLAEAIQRQANEANEDDTL